MQCGCKQQRRREDALKLKVLRSQLRAGVEALKRGDLVEIDETDVVRYLEDLSNATVDAAT